MPSKHDPDANPLDRLGPTVASLKLRQKAFPLQPGSSISAVVIRELSGFDDDEISRGLVLPPDAQMFWATKVMRREALRRSIVGYWPAGGGEFVQASQPFDGLDKFSQATRRQLDEYFEIMNGIEDVDLKKAAAAALEWQPGDGAPSWPGADASARSTGSE